MWKQQNNENLSVETMEHRHFVAGGVWHTRWALSEFQDTCPTANQVSYSSLYVFCLDTKQVG